MTYPTEQELVKARESALGLAVHRAVNADTGETAEAIVANASMFSNFLLNGTNPAQDRSEQLVKEVTASETQPVDEGIMSAEELERTGTDQQKGILVAKWIDYAHILPEEVRLKIVELHGPVITTFLDKGPDALTSLPLSNQLKNKVVETLLQIQEDFDVNFGLNEGDSFCDNCDQIHPSLESLIKSGTSSMEKSFLGKTPVAGFPGVSEDFARRLAEVGITSVAQVIKNRDKTFAVVKSNEDMAALTNITTHTLADPRMADLFAGMAPERLETLRNIAQVVANRFSGEGEATPNDLEQRARKTRALGVGLPDFLRQILAVPGASASMVESAEDFPQAEELAQRVRDELGEGFDVQTRVIKLNPGETPEQAIARELKANPMPGVELDAEGNLINTPINLTPPPTKH